MFSEIVGQIGCPWFTKHVAVDLAYYILYPIEPHIHCVGPFLVWCHFISPMGLSYISTWVLPVVGGPFPPV